MSERDDVIKVLKKLGSDGVGTFKGDQLVLPNSIIVDTFGFHYPYAFDIESSDKNHSFVIEDTIIDADDMNYEKIESILTDLVKKYSKMKKFDIIESIKKEMQTNMVDLKNASIIKDGYDFGFKVGDNILKFKLSDIKSYRNRQKLYIKLEKFIKKVNKTPKEESKKVIKYVLTLPRNITHDDYNSWKKKINTFGAKYNIELLGDKIFKDFDLYSPMLVKDEDGNQWRAGFFDTENPKAVKFKIDNQVKNGRVNPTVTVFGGES